MKNRIRIVYELWGDVTLDEIGRDQFVELDLHLKKKGRSEATINHYFGLLKSVFNYAIRMKKYSGENPVREIRPYLVEEKRREYSPNELERILDAAERIEKECRRQAKVQKYTKRVVLMLLYTAMRIGEVLNLKWENIKDDKIILRRTETKQRKEKVIPMTKGIREILKNLRDRRSTDGYVIPIERRGKEVSLTDMISKIRKYSGIQDFIFHNIRHTASTIMVSEALGKGVGLADVMKILGHSQVGTTMRYIHPDFSRMKRAMEVLEKKTKRRKIDNNRTKKLY
jgi:integrase